MYTSDALMLWLLLGDKRAEGTVKDAPSRVSSSLIHFSPDGCERVRTPYIHQMCGRFTYKLTWPELMRLYRLTLDAPGRNPQPRYNICPTDPIDAVIEQDGKRQLVPMRWGLVPSWWPKPLKELKAATFNARIETVADKPMFRDAFRSTRCLIPASGYYEWQDTPEGKQPQYFTRRDGQPITFAGLWALWRDKQAGETVKSCAMIITDANDFVAAVHDRMPVILEPEQFKPWLTGNAGVELLKPAANDLLQRWPVSKRVNSSRADADDPTLIEPLTGGDPNVSGAGLFA